MFYSAESKSEFMRSLLEKKGGHVHFVGVSGIGMAGLAYLFKVAGFTVSGCDLRLGAVSEWLVANGVVVLPGHAVDHVTAEVDCVIRSMAVDAGCDELLRAAELDIPVFARGEVLPRVLDNYNSIAVSGTHGKTTTSSFVAMLLKYAGLEPGWCIGGESDVLGGVAGAGDGNLMVVEADESDGTVAGYFPDVAVITNVEFDHMEHFSDKSAFEECFKSFIGQAHERVVFCNDDPAASGLCYGIENGLSYGLSADSDVCAENVIESADGSDFDLRVNGKWYGRIRLSVPGRHNILNALGAIAAIGAAGIDLSVIVPGVSELCLPKRRFEWVSTASGLRIISDYAHHPSEIAALVQMSGHIEARRRIVIFQPHRYTRTKALGSDFPAAFDGVDEVILLPVYAASEKPLRGGSYFDLYSHFRARMRNSGEPLPDVFLAESCGQVWEYLKANCTPDDLIMVVGAGNVIDIAGMAEAYVGNRWQMSVEGWQVDELSAVLKDSEFRRNMPLAGKTTLKVGGKADLWAEVGTESDLVKLQAWARARDINMIILGYGSNLVVGDLGIRGVVVRLTGDFKTIREEDGALIVGAAVPAALLLTWIEKIGGGGLEFLEAIPASVGGMLRMNAGAYGDEILNHILWIRCLNSDGTICILQKDDIKYGYRSCISLENLIVLEACFQLDYSSFEESKSKRVIYAERRCWMRGLRSCGSVFKNPGNEFAGKLIEDAGLKGKSIGGASVSEKHANFIVTEYNAVASDVKALIAYICDEVFECCGVELEREVKYL
jgi:UDP-N-acetylmuramate--L-alanine ligase/UDP-N-acetylenolpyruvoylglucosamine reductase